MVTVATLRRAHLGEEVAIGQIGRRAGPWAPAGCRRSRRAGPAAAPTIGHQRLEALLVAAIVVLEANPRDHVLGRAHDAREYSASSQPVNARRRRLTRPLAGGNVLLAAALAAPSGPGGPAMKSSSRSRRSFCVAAGAAAAGPLLLPARLFGAAAPSNRIRVGQIGCGRIAQRPRHAGRRSLRPRRHRRGLRRRLEARRQRQGCVAEKLQREAGLHRARDRRLPRPP